MTARFTACPHSNALLISKTTAAMAMLDFEILDQHHDDCASTKTVIKLAILSGLDIAF
jgi:hypothetical protein